MIQGHAMLRSFPPSSMYFILWFFYSSTVYGYNANLNRYQKMFSLCTESNYSIYLYNCIMPRYIELHTGMHKTVWCHTVLNYIQLYAIIYWTTYWGYIPLRFYPSGLLAHKHILGDSNLFGISLNFFLHLQSLTLVLEYLLGPIVKRYK